jgi:hypothetical protein
VNCARVHKNVGQHCSTASQARGKKVADVDDVENIKPKSSSLFKEYIYQELRAPNLEDYIHTVFLNWIIGPS